MNRTLLLTGAAGRIGVALIRYLDTMDGSCYTLRLADLKSDEARGQRLDITDLDACRAACRDIDTVIHLAGVASPEARFEAVLPTNIAGSFNVLRASADADVRRVILASSAQAVEGYPLDVQVRTDMPVRPKNLYGVSKACTETLGAYFAYQEGLEVVAVHIGAFEQPEDWEHLGARDLSAWVHPDDLCTLLVRCVEADLCREPFAIVHGISDNRFKRLDLTDTCDRLGYAPAADAFTVWNIGLSAQSEPANLRN